MEKELSEMMESAEKLIKAYKKRQAEKEDFMLSCVEEPKPDTPSSVGSKDSKPKTVVGGLYYQDVPQNTTRALPNKESVTTLKGGTHGQVGQRLGVS